MTYVPFLVAPLDSGISTYLKPWLQPDQAFIDMQDCYVYRGSVRKRYGFNLYGVFPLTVGTFQVGVGDGATTTFTFTLTYLNVGRRSLAITHTEGGVVITDGTDDGTGATTGNITGTNIASGTVDYFTGAVTINFTDPPDKNTPIRVDYGVKIAQGDGVTTVFTPTLPNTGSFGLPIISHSLFVRNTASNQNTLTTGDVPNSDGLAGVLSPGTGVVSGTITYATGVTSITFGVAPPAALADQDIWATWQFAAPSSPIKGIKFFWASNGDQNTVVFNNTQMAQLDPPNFTITNVTGSDFFTTTDSAFFSVANYLGSLYILNNTDRLTVYDGTNLYQPIVSFTLASPTVNELTTGLHCFVYKNRLVILRPTESTGVKGQRARFSALNNPGDFVSNVRGHGGFIDAPTGEWIVAAEFLRDELIVHFQFSTWKLRYTGVDTAPFRWEKINDMRRCDCPYATVSYQQYDTTLGATGLIKCDGVNVDRYDSKIIDYTEDNIDQDNLAVVNGFRFDQLNQQWLCHPSSTSSTTTNYSDTWLVWNFVEDTWATWNINSTCFGSYFQGIDLAWEDFNAANNMDWAWQDLNLAEATWFSFFTQGKTRIPMFGSKTGQLFSVFPAFTTDNGTNTGFTFTTKDFNPFVKDGKQARLGYIDFYFDRPDGQNDDDPNYLLTIDFYVNENESFYKTVILNPSMDNFRQKRVYTGAIGNFHHFTVFLSPAQIVSSTVATKGFLLNGFIMYFQPAGRITS